MIEKKMSEYKESVKKQEKERKERKAFIKQLMSTNLLTHKQNKEQRRI